MGTDRAHIFTVASTLRPASLSDETTHLPREATILVFTEDHLVRGALDKPLHQIDLSDLRGHTGASEFVMRADRVELRVGGRVFILKNRCGPCGEMLISER